MLRRPLQDHLRHVNTEERLPVVTVEAAWTAPGAAPVKTFYAGQARTEDR